ncbi:hypothetical protein GY45DRAFT_1439179 [Cubamyces sp. BRFM 1775]|nr:hypothetical protein GY45DRAFT_1439179 [Cubamyces sp. BRFM 1775]
MDKYSTFLSQPPDSSIGPFQPTMLPGLRTAPCLRTSSAGAIYRPSHVDLVWLWQLERKSRRLQPSLPCSPPSCTLPGVSAMFGPERRVLAFLFLLLVTIVQVYALPVHIQRAAVDSAHGTLSRYQLAMAEYHKLCSKPAQPGGEITSKQKTAFVESFEEWFNAPWQPEDSSDRIQKNMNPLPPSDSPSPDSEPIPGGAVPPQPAEVQLHPNAEPSNADRRFGLRNPAYQARVAHFAHDRAMPAPRSSSRAWPMPPAPSVGTLAFMALFLIFGAGVGWMYDSDSDSDDQDREPEVRL